MLLRSGKRTDGYSVHLIIEKTTLVIVCVITFDIIGKSSVYKQLTYHKIYSMKTSLMYSILTSNDDFNKSTFF